VVSSAGGGIGYVTRGGNKITWEHEDTKRKLLRPYTKRKGDVSSGIIQAIICSR